MPTSILNEKTGQQVHIFSHIEKTSDFRDFFENDYTHDTWFSKAMESYELYDYELASDYMKKAIRSLQSLENNLNTEEELMDYYDKYQSWAKIVESNNIKANDIGDVLTYGFKNDDSQIISEVYNKTGQLNKLDFINLTDIDPEKIINDYETMVKAEDTLDVEKDFFSIKAIKAYKSIILDQIKEG